MRIGAFVVWLPMAGLLATTTDVFDSKDSGVRTMPADHHSHCLLNLCNLLHVEQRVRGSKMCWYRIWSELAYFKHL
jgi:hypothetical protein